MRLCCFQGVGAFRKSTFQGVGMYIFWNQMLEFASVGFYGGRKTRGPGETFFEQGQKPIVHSTQVWDQGIEHSHHVLSPSINNSTVNIS